MTATALSHLSLVDALLLAGGLILLVVSGGHGRGGHGR